MQIITYILTYFVDNKQQTMKGRIQKTISGEWVVRVVSEETPECDTIVEHGTQYSLHPDDVKQINADAQVFDNIEARIKAYPDVEFDWCVIVQPDGKGKEYAKLLNH
jgi:hypothetical protein